MLRNIAIIFVIALALVVVAKWRGCSKPLESTSGTITMPNDTNYIPVKHEEAQPSSLPWAKNKLGVKLPEGVKEKDVKKITNIEYRTSNGDSGQTKEVSIIETKSGEIFVRKDSSIQSVTEIIIKPPLVEFSLTFGVGLSLTKRGEFFRPMPCGTFTPVCWSGWLKAPLLAVDFEGIGLGAAVKLYHDIDIGAAKIYNFGESSQLKLIVTYNF